jgi:hypothetical protein
MNAEERQALREKHRNWVWDDPGKDENPYFQCVECGEVGFDEPCDVIKVLDALEEVLEQVNYNITECDHTTLDNNVVRRWWFYCPKCQEMLYS